MQRYKLLERDIGSDDESFQLVAEQAFLAKSAALFLCRPDAPPRLYLSSWHGAYVLSRWPCTGHARFPGWEDYEALIF